MEKNYIYEWLDKLCSHDLNPEMVYPGAVDKAETETMQVLISTEIERIEQKLKAMFLNERKGNELSLLVQKYHDMLVIMMDRVHQHTNHSYSRPTGLHTMLQFLMRKLEDLLAFFELTFGSYMRKSIRVPQAHLLSVKRELLTKWENLQEVLPAQHHSGLINIVHQVLSLFVSRIDKQEGVTLREVKYHRRLIDDLVNTPAFETQLREMVIYRNLNNSDTTRYLTRQLDQLLAHKSSAQEKLEILRLEFKAIAQIRVSRRQVYDPKYPGLKQFLCEYIDNEIMYLEQKLEGFKPLEDQIVPQPAAFKVVANLSTDQLAIFLRAADEMRVLVARSMSTVFKTLVPFLSTTKKKDLSWESVRTKSYDAENKDKEKVIAVLEEMIKRIKSY